jgi:hypothetical protein
MICFIFFFYEVITFSNKHSTILLVLDFASVYFCYHFFIFQVTFGLTKLGGSHRVNPYIVFFNMLATPNFFYIKKQIDLAHGAV